MCLSHVFAIVMVIFLAAPFANEPDYPQPVGSDRDHIPMLRIDGLKSPIPENTGTTSEKPEVNGSAVPLDEHIRDSPRRLGIFRQDTTTFFSLFSVSTTNNYPTIF